MKVSEYNSKRFLVVDAFKNFRESIAKMLEARGAKKINFAHSSKEAIQKCQSTKYDVILMGYDLGEGKQNGQQGLEELRSQGLLSRRAIFILVTGETSQAMVLSALEHKPDGYLTKPFSARDLVSRIENCYKKKMSMAAIYQAMDQKCSSDVISLCDNHIDNNSPYTSECLGIKSRQLYELQRYEEALAIYHSKIDEPNCQWAAIGIGKIKLAENNAQEAKQMFQRVINKTPLYLAAYDWLAKAHIALEEFDEAEQVLAKAVALSPRSVRRIKQYAGVCEGNLSFENASKAYSQAVDLAKHSVHHGPENELNLARSLSEQSLQAQDSKQIFQLQSQALKALSQARAEFKTPEIAIQTSLGAARVYQLQNDIESAHKALTDAENIWQQQNEDLSPQLKLEFAKSYDHLNMTSKAEDILAQLVIAYGDDDDILAQIDKLVENPLSEKGRIAAQQSIKTGITLYKNENFTGAIKEFSAAIRMYPKHIGIKLNLIQALLMAFESDRDDYASLNRGQKHLAQLGNLTSEHPLYSRFKKLEQKCNQLNSSFSTSFE